MNLHNLSLRQPSRCVYYVTYNTHVVYSAMHIRGTCNVVQNRML